MLRRKLGPSRFYTRTLFETSFAITRLRIVCNSAQTHVAVELWQCELFMKHSAILCQTANRAGEISIQFLFPFMINYHVAGLWLDFGWTFYCICHRNGGGVLNLFHIIRLAWSFVTQRTSTTHKESCKTLNTVNWHLMYSYLRRVRQWDSSLYWLDRQQNILVCLIVYVTPAFSLDWFTPLKP